jgi:hypothetical protein
MNSGLVGDGPNAEAEAETTMGFSFRISDKATDIG